jgi:hypothetical protein
VRFDLLDDVVGLVWGSAVIGHLVECSSVIVRKSFVPVRLRTILDGIQFIFNLFFTFKQIFSLLFSIWQIYLLIELTLGTLSMSHMPSLTNRSFISHANIVGF